MRHLPSLNALRAFEATARLGRMTVAATELSVTHGAISRQIKALEDQLGCKLLEGPKNRLALTETGKRLLPSLTTGFDHIARGIQEVSDVDATSLNVSCLGTLTMRWLIPRLHRFQAREPDIEVRLSAADGPVDFQRHHFDVAIRVGTDPWPADANVTTLFEEVVGPVLSPRLLPRSGRCDLQRLSAQPKLHTKTRPSAWTDWCARTGIKKLPASGPTFEHFYFALEAATGGLGAAIAPWPLVIDDVRAGRLIAPFGFIDSGLRYVALRRQRSGRLAQRFVSWLVAEGKALPAPHLRAISTQDRSGL